MRTLPLDAEYRDIAAGRDAATGLESVRTRVIERLRFWRESWFVDRESGVPYLAGIVGRPGTDYIPRSIITEQARSVEGVTGVSSVVYAFDGNTRRITYSAAIDTIYGSTEVSMELEQAAS